MLVSIMQPYYVPYIGYWELIARSDVFVLYDDAQYKKGGWINRNRIIYNGELKYLTIPINNASPHKRIFDLEPSVNFNEYMEGVRNKLENYYGYSAHFEQLVDFINETHVESEFWNLGKFLDANIRNTCSKFEIKTRIFRSSEIQYNRSGDAQTKVISICNAVGATKYINPLGGKTLYSEQKFIENGVALNFTESNLARRLGNASIIDLVARHGVDVISEQINGIKTS